MAGYIKSHSNYRLQTRHQIVNDGVIFERDISTVGGVNSFATGQATIYQSGNFVMVVNNSSQASRHIRKKGWLASGNDDDTWNQEILSQHSSDINGSLEKSIMLKNDFMDLRSFAYYGSLSDLIQNTVLKIISTYPYELYYDKNSNIIEVTGSTQTAEIDQSHVAVVGDVEYYYTNVTIQEYEKLVLKTEGSVILINESGSWSVSPKNYDETVQGQKTVIIGKPSTSVDSNVDYQLNNLFREVSNPGDIDIHNVTTSNSNVNGELGHFYNGGYINYEIFEDDEHIDDAVGFEWNSSPIQFEKVCPKPWEKFATITITTIQLNRTITLYAYWDDNLNIVYLTNENTSFHIRPKIANGYYDDFVDSLDLFGKCLVGVYSGIRNTSKFEILRETDKGTKRDVKTFTIPSAPGGYNINSDSISMQDYISELGKVGIRYDEMYTDNLFRMMTHDSLKNLDWTNNFNGNDGDEADNEYIKTGEKFSSVIRVMGYTFDQEKAYIDSIGNVNTVTYSNRNNLSDYFLTDALESDGICVNAIYPYELTEYDSSGDTVDQSDWDISNQFSNKYTRKFSENTAEIIYPYDYFDGAYYTKCVSGSSETLPVPNYDGEDYYVEDGKTYNVITNYHNTSEISIPDVNNEFMKRFKINSRYILRKKGTIDGIESVLSLFGMKSKRWCGDDESMCDFSISETTYFANPIMDTMDDVHGMHRIDWYNSCKTIPYDTQSYINGEYIPYQGLPVAYRENPKYRFNPKINYTNFVGSISRIEHPVWREVVTDSENKVLFGIRHDGSYYEANVDGYTMEDSSGNTEPVYSIIGGLEKPRKLYPFFQSEGVYDGDMYYQMNGGWIGYLPYRFDVDDKFLVSNNGDTRVETMRNIMQVKDLSELISQPIGDLYNNIIYYVSDISEKFALINGYPYKIKDESINGDLKYYFEVEIRAGSVSIGGELYNGVISVTDIDGSMSDYDLSIYNDGTPLRIYYTGNREKAFKIEADGYHPGSSRLFSGGTYDEDVRYVSNYFILKDVNFAGQIGKGFWEEIPNDSRLYQEVENITDKTSGNNPHSGNFSYDNGEEYLNRFRKLFKYADEYRYFNESCFADVNNAYNEINEYGFSLSKINDSKVHSFIDRINEDGSETYYDVNNSSSISGITEYSDAANSECSDGATSQIINTKKIDLTFYLHFDTVYEKNAQEEIKYIQCRIMPYVEQMIPSTSIVNVNFMAK